MAKVARIGDQGYGTCHNHDHPVDCTITFTSGDSYVTADGIPVCVVGSVGTTSCGHTIIATTGSSICVGTGGKGIHRVGDTGEVVGGGTYTVTSGSPTVDSL